MPRLLLACEYPTLLGGERSLLSTLPAVLQAGFEVDVVCPPAGPLADAVASRGVRVVGYSARETSGRRRPLVELRRELEQLIRGENPDLLHANSLSMARILGPVAASLRLASIGHLRDIVKLSAAAVGDLNRHRRMIAVSRATKDFHVAQGLDVEKCVVLHNGVDLTKFQPRPHSGYLDRELGLPANAQLIVSIGQIGLRKGTDVAMEAFHSIAAQNANVHWLVVGERTSDKVESRAFEFALHIAAATPPLVGRVHFLGTRDDIPQLLAECELLMHAAHQEPLGRVLLESAAAGLPVVATDVGGTREIFTGENDGAVLVPAADPNALADAVLGVLSDACRQRSLAAAGRRRAVAAFDINSAVAALVDLYRQVLVGR